MCFGSEPQHPPTTLAPIDIAFLIISKNSLSEQVFLMFPSEEGSPKPKLGYIPHFCDQCVLISLDALIVRIKGLQFNKIVSTGKNFIEAKIAMDVGINSLSVTMNAIKYGKFKTIDEKEIFRMEYWPLELAKIKKSNLPLQGNVTIISGGLGTIGYATALKFLKEGSEVVLLDKINNNKNINGMTFFKCDVTNEDEIRKVLG